MSFRTLVCLLLMAASAQAEPTKSSGTLVDFSAESTTTVANDLAQAVAYMEAGDVAAGPLAKRVNAAMAQALATTKAYSAVKAKSGNTWTNPVYGKNDRSIQSWRMRSELLLESRDVAVLAELLGKLQASLAVGQITLMPAPETRRKAEEAATQEAILAFQDKARRIAATLGKPYRIRQMNIGNSGGRPPFYPMARAAMMQAEAAPMPVEAGDSTLTVSISGQIELTE